LQHTPDHLQLPHAYPTGNPYAHAIDQWAQVVPLFLNSKPAKEKDAQQCVSLGSNLAAFHSSTSFASFYHS
jgi:hypothetical protein